MKSFIRVRTIRIPECAFWWDIPLKMSALGGFSLNYSLDNDLKIYGDVWYLRLILVSELLSRKIKSFMGSFLGQVLLPIYFFKDQTLYNNMQLMK